MTAEKEILRRWLNNRGYAVFSDINSGQRVIDMIAFKDKEVIHVESMCSTGPIEITKKEVEKKFSDTAKEVRKVIRKHIGKERGYARWLVTGPSGQSPKLPPGIKLVRFEDVLTEVMINLDRQNYRDPVIRGVQLIKYILLSDSTSASSVLAASQSTSSQESFIKTYLSDEGRLRHLGKPEFEEILIKSLIRSPVSKPERLAKVLINQVLGSRGRYKFMRELLKDKQMRENLEKSLSKRQLKEIIKRKEKTLDQFMK